MSIENKGPGGVGNSYGARSTQQPTKINSTSPKGVYNEFDKGAAATFSADGKSLVGVDGIPTEVVFGPMAFVDFTLQPNGLPSSVLDTTQAVDYTFNAGGRYPVISSGKLVVNNQAGAGTGALADYYQSDLGVPITRVGVEFTMPSGADDGNGNTTYAAWDTVYEGGGTNVGKSWVHMSLIAGTGATGTAKWFVCNGIGNLFVVKQQTFANPAADGKTIWRCESILDEANGIAYSILPDGSLMTLTNSEIAAMCTTLAIPIVTYSDLSSRVMMCEHFCTTGANAAKFAQFTAHWAETTQSESKVSQARFLTPKYLASVLQALKATISPLPVNVLYAPTTALTSTTTTTASSVDATNVKVTATVGPSGKLYILVTAYYEWSATDIVYWRVIGTVNSATRVAGNGVSGQKGLLTQVIEITGLTPGASVNYVFQHWSVSAGSATLKAGGTGGTMLPPITMLAIPA